MRSFCSWQHLLCLPEHTRSGFRFLMVVLLLVLLSMLSACGHRGDDEQISENVLKSVAAISATDIWAVGQMSNPSLSAGWEQVLIEHWNGKAWHTVPASVPGNLSGLAAVTTNDVWAVGSTGSHMLTMHWDGTRWSQVATGDPNLAGESGNVLAAVVAVSSHDIWAVGQQGNVPAILHWSGQRWQFVAPTLPSEFETGALNSVQAMSSTNVWAIGWYSKTIGERIHYPLAEHWDGQNWQPVPTADLPQDHHLPGSTFSALVVFPSGTLWAVGETHVSVDPTPSTLVERWTGSQWQAVPLSLDTNIASSYQHNIFAVNAQDLWITEYHYSRTTGTNYPLLLHWNGQSWHNATPPALQTTSSVFFAGAAIAANDLWVVGSSGGQFPPAGSTKPLDSHTLIEHWDGTRWSTVPSPNPGQPRPVPQG